MNPEKPIYKARLRYLYQRRYSGITGEKEIKNEILLPCLKRVPVTIVAFLAF